MPILLFTVFFTVVCPNQTFTAWKVGLTSPEALIELSDAALGSYSVPTDDKRACTIVGARIGE